MCWGAEKKNVSKNSNKELIGKKGKKARKCDNGATKNIYIPKLKVTSFSVTETFFGWGVV